jgi:hypothetical protein
MTTWILRFCGIALAILSLNGAWAGFRTDAAFAEHGAKTVIEPVTVYEQTVTTTKKVGITVGQSTRNATFVSFKTAAGQPMRVHMNLPDTVLAMLNAQRPVMVEYLPEDPTITRFAGSTSGYGTLLLIGVVVLGLTVVFWKHA